MKTIPKNIITEFEKRVFEFRDEEIFKLSEINGNVFSVVCGIHKEVFGVIVIDDSKNDFDYIIYYISSLENQLKGFFLELKPSQNYRNELVSLFSSFITKKFIGENQDIFEDIFNTFQQSQTVMYEKLGFNVIDDTINNCKGDLAIKSAGKGIVFLPLIRKENISIEPINLQKIRALKESEHFVYLMYNKSNAYYKIGRTKNKSSLEYREKTLQAQEPEVYTIDVWIVSENFEKKLHSKFSNKRKRGEWFELSNNDIIELKRFMKNFSVR